MALLEIEATLHRTPRQPRTRRAPARPQTAALRDGAGNVHRVQGAAAGVLAVTIALAFAPACRGQSPGTIDPHQEYNVKAAFLYSFGRYVEWPHEAFPEAGDQFVIGVLGHNPFGDRLDRIAARKQIHGRQIVVRRLRSLAEYRPCHILFFPRTTTAAEQIDAIGRMQGAHVLLVGETTDFASRGGVVNFYIAQDTVRFEINVDAAKKQRLTINAKLLSLAKTVKGS